LNSYYPLLKDHIIDIHVPIELANKDLPLSPSNPHLGLKINYKSVSFERLIAEEEEGIYTQVQDDYNGPGDVTVIKSKLYGQESTVNNCPMQLDTLNI
jgi:hypothetical protein